MYFVYYILPCLLPVFYFTLHLAFVCISAYLYAFIRMIIYAFIQSIIITTINYCNAAMHDLSLTFFPIVS